MTKKSISYKVLCRLVSDSESNPNKIPCSNAIDVLIYNFNNARELHPTFLSQGLWKVSEDHLRCNPKELMGFADVQFSFDKMENGVRNVCKNPKLVDTYQFSDAFMRTLREIASWNATKRKEFAEWFEKVLTQFTEFKRNQDEIERTEGFRVKFEKQLSEANLELENYISNNKYQDPDVINDIKNKIKDIKLSIKNTDTALTQYREKSTVYFVGTIYIYTMCNKVHSPLYLYLKRLNKSDYSYRENGKLKYVNLDSLEFLNLVHNSMCDDCGVKGVNYHPLYAVDFDAMYKCMDKLLLDTLKLPTRTTGGVCYVLINPNHKSCPKAVKFGIENGLISIEQLTFLYYHINKLRPTFSTSTIEDTIDNIIKSTPDFKYTSYLKSCIEAYHLCNKRFESIIKRNDATVKSLKTDFLRKNPEFKTKLDKYLNDNREDLEYECLIANTLLQCVKEFNSMPNVPRDFVLRFCPRLSNKSFITHQFFFDDGEEQDGKSVTYEHNYLYVTGRATCNFATASNPYNLFKNYNKQYYKRKRLFNLVPRNLKRQQRSEIMERLKVFSVGFAEKHGKHQKTHTRLDDFGVENIIDPENLTDAFVERFEALSDLSASIPNIVMMWRYANKDVIDGVDLELFYKDDFFWDWHTTTAEVTGVNRSTIKIASMKGIFNSQKTNEDFDLYVKSMILNLLNKDGKNLSFDKSDGIRSSWKWALDEMVKRGLLDDDKHYRIKDLKEFRNANLKGFGALGKWMKGQIRGLSATRQMYSVKSLGYGKPFFIEGIVVIKSVIDTINYFDFVESCGMKYDAVSFTYNRQVTTDQIIEVLTYWQKKCKEYLRKVVLNIYNKEKKII